MDRKTRRKVKRIYELLFAKRENCIFYSTIFGEACLRRKILGRPPCRGMCKYFEPCISKEDVEKALRAEKRRQSKNKRK